MKRMATLVLALLLLLSMAVPAMAEAPTAKQHTITINNTNLPDGHEYTAYQVFTGDLVVKDGKKILTNIKWGAGVDGTKLLDELKKDATIGSKFATCESAIDVADKMNELNENQVKAFAAVVAKCLSKTVAGTSEQTKAPYTITVDDGYYFIKDKNENLDNTKVDAITRYMLQVVGDVEVKVKADVPSIEKKIIVGTDKEVDYNERSVGESEKYQITSRIPDMSAFDTYTFVMTDTFSKGLTYNEDIKIVIDDEEGTTADTELTKDTDYTVTKTSAENGETTLTITFTNFKKWQAKKEQNIIVTYSATINENAELGTAGNPNSVKLKYSNNPNLSGSGDSNHSTGETPEDTVYTYVTGIKLTKKDTGGNILTGAKFKIEGFSNEIVIINNEIYRESATGTYYRLKNGTYTTTVPIDTTKNEYDGETKYEKVTVVNKETVKTPVVAEGWVDENGVISFKGLGEGTYTITELVAPEGYNKLEDSIKIEIKWTAPENSTTCTWTATKDGKDTLTLDNEGIFTFEVVNKAGNTLPSTGGIGTTVFYAVGGLLLVGAVIVMITRKRMSAEK